MTTRRYFIRNVITSTAFIFSSSLFSKEKTRISEDNIEEIKQEDILYVISKKSLEGILTDSYFDVIK